MEKFSAAPRVFMVDIVRYNNIGLLSSLLATSSRQAVVLAWIKITES